jgi:DMSO/TMAO reductase YedYZ molybdopterin-dependent catalytic subunit
MRRRDFLVTLARASAASAAIASLPPWARAAAPATPAELIERNDWPEHWETTVAGLGRGWITPESRFFVRSHFPVPTVDRAAWRLEIAGLVERPLTLTLAELIAMGRVERAHTLECAGNGRGLFALPRTSGTQWELGAVGNARWSGVPLAAVLERAGVKPEAKHVWFETADRAPLPGVPPFLRSIPLEKARADVLLADQMNGAPLSRLHGAPLRAIVPGWFGMASAKWLTKVRLEAAVSDNQFMAKGYRYAYPGADPAQAPPVEQMRVKSLITRPLEGTRVAPGWLRIEGFAWAGEAGVSQVEVSSDGGAHWHGATLMGEASPGAWRSWFASLDAHVPGPLTLLARATDGAGEVQPLEAQPNAGGYGNNSIHRVTVRVG